MTPPVVVTIAGSDSGGGAGIQADLKAITANGGFATTVITAITAQNTTVVSRVHVTPIEYVEAQLDAVLSDFRVQAVKTGMLATAEIVELVATRAARGDLPNLVVDPVMVSSSGDRLLADDAVSAYRDGLIPNARVVTPNRREAEVLVARELGSLEAMTSAAVELQASGVELAVVKGGHPPTEATEGIAIDVVASAVGVTPLSGPWIHTTNVHGTGCSFASALATGLAFDLDPLEAASLAKAYVADALMAGSGWRLGAGHGPIDHFARWRPSDLAF